MTQISPAIRRARALTLDEPDCHGSACRPRAPRRRTRPSLADALLQPPSPETIPVLRDLNLPAIPGVPPIVILQGGERGRRSHDETRGRTPGPQLPQ